MQESSRVSTRLFFYVLIYMSILQKIANFLLKTH